MDINKLQSLVSSPTWHLFEEYLQDEQKMSVKRAMNSSEDKEIYKAQGRFALTEQILNIRTTILK
mgnify:CR=1|jgi:hypothetical protein|tara:strand:+ start:472 stop:666 length:195 start_codon:yes stop_codon:yes gene_type:complete